MTRPAPGSVFIVGARRSALVIAALLLLVAAIYGRVGFYGFVAEYDDAQYILDNPHVRAGLGADSAAWALTSVGYAANWHPLTWLSHLLDVSLFGLDARGHHVVSVLIHGANAALLFLVLRGLTGEHWRSALAAAIFAAHPLQTESVAWVAERKSVLSTLFWLLAIAAHLAHRRRPGRGRYALVALALAAGLAAKPMLVTLPFTLLLLDIWPLGLLAGGARPGAPAPWRRALLEAAPLLALSAVASLVTLRAQQAGTALATLERLPFAERVANALTSWVTYAALALRPVGLAVFHRLDPGALFSPKVVGAALALAAITALAIAGARHRPWLAIGWLWFLGTLAPAIGLVQVGDQGLAERYAYVPLIGLVVAVCWALPSPRRPATAAVAAATAASALLALAVAASVQAGTWRDGETLFRRSLAVDPLSYVAHNNLGVALRRRDRDTEAFEHFSRAASLRPGYADARYNRGILLYERGLLEPAAVEYRAALQARPDYEEALCNLGAILYRQERYDEAADRLREALRLRPGDIVARNNLEAALRRGR